MDFGSQTLRLLDEFPLPGSGDVQELRIIGQVDECHNGEIIEMSSLDAIRHRSPVVLSAYQLRQKYPALQRDVFPLSPLVRRGPVPAQVVQEAQIWFLFGSHLRKAIPEMRENPTSANR